MRPTGTIMINELKYICKILSLLCDLVTIVTVEYLFDLKMVTLSIILMKNMVFLAFLKVFKQNSICSVNISTDQQYYSTMIVR